MLCNAQLQWTRTLSWRRETGSRLSGGGWGTVPGLPTEPPLHRLSMTLVLRFIISTNIWLGGAIGRSSDLQFTGRGFESWLGSGHHCVVALGKLQLPITIIWYRPRGVISLAGKVTTGFMTKSPVGLLPRNMDHPCPTLVIDYGTTLLYLWTSHLRGYILLTTWLTCCMFNCRQALHPLTTRVNCWSPSNRKLRRSTCANCASISWYPNRRISHSRAENQLLICPLASTECQMTNFRSVSGVCCLRFLNSKLNILVH